MTNNPVISGVLQSGTITDSQTLDLRRTLYGDMTITEDEAAGLFAINDSCTQQGNAWSEFFIEAIGDFIVHQQKPRDYVDEANARWLMQHTKQDGQLESVNELELLISIFEKAKTVPDSLVGFALDQVKAAVITGSGPLRSGLELSPGVVTEGDVTILRRILYAYGSGGNIGITALEAETLFDINDATDGSNNHPSWPVLFSQAIANHLMVAQGHSAMARDEALRLEQWLDTPDHGTGSFLASMVKGLRSIYTSEPVPDRQTVYEKRVTESEKITGYEAQWLVNRINRSSKLSDAEQAVLTFIKHNATEIHPSLQTLLEKVA